MEEQQKSKQHSVFLLPLGHSLASKVVRSWRSYLTSAAKTAASDPDFSLHGRDAEEIQRQKKKSGVDGHTQKRIASNHDVITRSRT
jgi:hypothetical protein